MLCPSCEIGEMEYSPIDLPCSECLASGMLISGEDCRRCYGGGFIEKMGLCCDECGYEEMLKGKK